MFFSSTKHTIGSSKRIINKPKRGIGKTTIDKLEEKSIETGKSIFDLIQDLTPDELSAVVGKKNSRTLKVFEAEKAICDHELAVGTVVTDGKKYAKVALSDGYINLKSVQIAGKKRMDIGELLRGMRF